MARHARPDANSTQDAPDWGYPETPAGAATYARDAYVGGRGQAKRRGGKAKWLLLIPAAILVIAIAAAVAVGAYANAFSAKVQGNLSTPQEMSDVLTPAAAGEPYYILLLGSDWRENTGTSNLKENSGDNQRADVIILCRMDPATKLVTMVSVPRDTRWYHDGEVNKINEAYNIGGAALQTKVVSELTGVPIAHTVETHFSGLENLVDALGGVDVDVPQEITYVDALTGEDVTVEAGRQHINGQAAQIFARVRKAYQDGDGTRQSNVRQLVGAIADAILDKPITEYPGLGLQIADCFGSDMGLFDIIGLARDFGSGYKIYSGTGPTAGDFDQNQGGLWLCYENPEGWKRVMDVVEAGEDPSDVDPNLETSQEADPYSEYVEDYGYADYGYVDYGYAEY